MLNYFFTFFFFFFGGGGGELSSDVIMYSTCSNGNSGVRHPNS